MVSLFKLRNLVPLSFASLALIKSLFIFVPCCPKNSRASSTLSQLASGLAVETKINDAVDFANKVKNTDWVAGYSGSGSITDHKRGVIYEYIMRRVDMCRMGQNIGTQENPEYLDDPK